MRTRSCRTLTTAWWIWSICPTSGSGWWRWCLSLNIAAAVYVGFISFCWFCKFFFLFIFFSYFLVIVNVVVVAVVVAVFSFWCYATVLLLIKQFVVATDNVIYVVLFYVSFIFCCCLEFTMLRSPRIDRKDQLLDQPSSLVSVG